MIVRYIDSPPLEGEACGGLSADWEESGMVGVVIADEDAGDDEWDVREEEGSLVIEPPLCV